MRLGCEPAVFTISDDEAESDDVSSLSEVMTPPWRIPSPSASLSVSPWSQLYSPGSPDVFRSPLAYALPSTPLSPTTPDKLQMWLDDSSRDESYVCSPVAASFSTEGILSAVFKLEISKQNKVLDQNFERI